MKPVDLLLASMPLLAVVTGMFLFRESFVRKDSDDVIGALKSRTLGALILLTSLLLTGFLCSSLWSKYGIPAAIALLFGYGLAMAFGHRIIRSHLAWQCMMNATVGAWIVWFAAQDGRISGQEVFLLGGLATWIATSMFLGWKQSRHPSSSSGRSDVSGKYDR